MQVIDKFLSAFNRKGRNYDFAFFFDCTADYFSKFVHCYGCILMLSVSVSTFKEDVIRWRKVRSRVTDNRLHFATQVTCVQDSDFIFSFATVISAAPLRPLVSRLFLRTSLTAVGSASFVVLFPAKKLIPDSEDI